MKYLALALALFAAGLALAIFGPEEQTYIPVVRVRTPEGLYITGVQPPTRNRRACKDSLEELAKPLLARCRDCVAESECVVNPAGMESALAKGNEVPVHTVIAKSVRLALVGPPNALQVACQDLASRMSLSGLEGAACVNPKQAAYADSGPYNPVVKVTMAEGLSLTAILARTKEREACGRASERFLTPFKACKDCKVTMNTCERELKGLELGLRQGDALPYPVIVAKDSRIAVLGPPAAAKATCQAAVAYMISQDFRSAACIPPRVARPKS